MHTFEVSRHLNNLVLTLENEDSSSGIWTACNTLAKA